MSSPERVWMESLRQGGVPLPGPPPGTPTRGPVAPPPPPMRSAHSYQPLQRFPSGSEASSELKFAFDMDLHQKFENVILIIFFVHFDAFINVFSFQHEYTQLTEASPPPSSSDKTSPPLVPPPLFNPSSYSLQDISKRKQPPPQPKKN